MMNINPIEVPSQPSVLARVQGGDLARCWVSHSFFWGLTACTGQCFGGCRRGFPCSGAIYSQVKEKRDDKERRVFLKLRACDTWLSSRVGNL